MKLELNWSEPKLIDTKSGQRVLKKAPPNEKFWEAWQNDKEAIKKAGYSVGKYEGNWEVCHWQKPDEAAEPQPQATEPDLSASSATTSSLVVPAPEGLSYMPFQLAAIAYASKRKGTLLGLEQGLGKGLTLDHILPTVDGMGLGIKHIKIGDSVIGSDGKPVKVTGVYPQPVQQIYRVKFKDGSFVDCDGSHLWRVTNHDRKLHEKRTGSEWMDMATIDLFEFPAEKMRGNWMLPLAKPVHMPEKKFPVDPYTMGIIIAEGYISSSVMVSIGDLDKDIIQKLPVNRHESKKQGCTCVLLRGLIGKIRRMMGSHCLSKNKFIPPQYLKGSIAQRKELLRGIMDGDGSISRNRVVLSTTSEFLTRQVKELVASLGGIAIIHSYDRTKEGKGIEYQVNVKTFFNPFSCKRKASQWKLPALHMQAKRTIVEIEKTNRFEPTVCITVDAPDKLFLCGDDYIVTHNTVVSVGVINNDPAIKKVLVVCPASLKLNWRNEVAKWSVRQPGIAVIRDGATWVVPDDGDLRVTIINYDLLVKHHAKLTAAEWDLLILDECQAIKNGKAKRTKCVVGGGRGKSAIKPIAAKQKLALSGTPIPNRPIEIYNVAHLLDPYTFPNYYAFGNRYCDGKPGWGGSRDFSGSSNLGELQSKLRKSCMYRVLKEQVLDDLPDKTHQIIELPPTEDLKRELDEEKRAYRLHNETRAKLKKLRESASEAGGKEKHAEEVERLKDGLSVAFAEMSKVRAKIAELKAPFVIDHLLALLEAEPDRKIVAFCWHKSLLGNVLESLAQAKIKAVSIHGGTPMEERQKAVDDFQTGDAMVFVGNIIAAGTGITLTASSTCVFLEQDWTPGNLSQASDRCHRIGQKNNVLIQYLIMENSLDSTMAKRIGEKQSNIDKALDAPPEPEPDPEPELDLKIPEPKKEPKPEPKPITLDQRDAARQALQHIVKLDSDRASVVNGVGFSKYDGVSGHRLAQQQHWSDREAAYAVSLARKYRRQLPDHIISAL